MFDARGAAEAAPFQTTNGAVHTALRYCVRFASANRKKLLVISKSIRWELLSVCRRPSSSSVSKSTTFDACSSAVDQHLNFTFGGLQLLLAGVGELEALLEQAYGVFERELALFQLLDYGLQR